MKKTETEKEKKLICYIDMDNVIVNFESGIEKLTERQKTKYQGRLDEVPHIFSFMEPVEGAIEAVKELAKKYDVYVLSTSPFQNPTAWKDKIEWIHKYFGKDQSSILYKRLILTHHKDLNKGDILIDDRTKNGADKFEGELILFKSDKYPNWEVVLKDLLNRKN